MVVHTYTAEIYYYQNKLHDITQYGKDHGGFGFSAQNYNSKTKLIFPLQQFGSIWLGIAKPKMLKPFQQVVTL